MADVAVPTAAPLSALRRVELVHTGEWQIGSGNWRASRDDLVAAVAALDCPAVRRPVLKLGHSQGEEPLWAGNPTGVPAVGWVDNLATTNQGHTLVGDFVGMPGWLGDVAASAYPDRSVEGTYDHRCQIGHTHPFVVTAVALLGVTRPGVGTLRSLQDVGRLYGVQADTGTVAAFDPDQPRWPEGAPGGLGGQWRDGTPDLAGGSILSTTLDTAAGRLEVRAEPDGLHLGFGSSRSGALDRDATRKLADLLESVGPAEDEGEEDSRLVNSVATFDSSDAPPSGFAQVTQQGSRFELELLSDDNTLPLTRAEANRLAETLGNYSAASRVDTSAGPVDLHLDGDQVGMRVPTSDGRHELSFTPDEWARIGQAINIVWEGFDELGDVTDPGRDITSLQVETADGPLLVSRRGDPGGEPTLTLGAADGGWSFSWPGRFDHPWFQATTALEEIAGDFESTSGGISVVASATATGHVEGLTLGDSGLDLDLWDGGAVTLGWGEHQTELAERGAQGLVGAVNQVRGGEAITVDAGPIRAGRAAGGDVALTAGGSSILLSDDDAFDLQSAIVGWFPAEGPVQARVFDPAKHPRWPKGTPGGLGGRFMPRDLVPRASGGGSRSTRRSTPPARSRSAPRRTRTGVTQADQQRTSQALQDLDERVSRVPGSSQGRGEVPALTDTVRSIREGVDRGETTPDQAQVALSQLVFRNDVANDERLADPLHRAINELREPPSAPDAPSAPEPRAPEAPPAPEPAQPTAPTAPDELDRRVTDTLQGLLATRRAAGSSDFIPIADIREALPDLSRQELDDTLRRLSVEGDRPVILTPESNQKALPQRDRDAAVIQGNQPKHYVSLDEAALPSRSPAPEAPTPEPTQPAAPNPQPSPGAPEGDLLGRLRSAGSREEAQAMLSGLSAAQLKALAREAGIAFRSNATKPQLVDTIVRNTVGRRLDFESIMRGGGGPGSGVQAAAQDDAGWPIMDDDGRIIMAQADRNQLKHYWTRDPRGLARWAGKPHPWTALFRQIRKHVGSARAKRIASQWFKEVFGIWPGERKGKNPAGPG